MPPKGKDKKKAPTPKTVKEVAQESAGVMWLMDRTGFNKKELVRACAAQHFVGVGPAV